MAKISQLDHEFANYAATEAGKLLLEIRAGNHNLDSSNLDLGAYGDIQSHELLVQLISDQFPDDMILSEEATEDPSSQPRPSMDYRPTRWNSRVLH